MGLRALGADVGAVLVGRADHLPGAAVGEEADAGHAGVGAVLGGGVAGGDEGVVGAGDRGADAVGGHQAEVVFGAFLEAAELGADFLLFAVRGGKPFAGNGGAVGGVGPYSKWHSVIAVLWGLRKPRRWTLSAIGSSGPVWTVGARAPVVKGPAASAMVSPPAFEARRRRR